MPFIELAINAMLPRGVSVSLDPEPAFKTMSFRVMNFKCPAA